MNLKKLQNWPLIVSISALLGVVIIFVSSIIRTFVNPCPFPSRPHFGSVSFRFFGFSTFLIVIGVIALSYYFLSKRLDDRLEKNIHVLSKLVKSNNGHGAGKKEDIKTKDVVMKFLNPDERIVLNKIIFKKGSCLQSEITRLKEMTKLRTHRAVKSLESKDIIVSEEQGKTNKLSLAKDIRDVLLK